MGGIPGGIVPKVLSAPWLASMEWRARNVAFSKYFFVAYRTAVRGSDPTLDTATGDGVAMIMLTQARIEVAAGGGLFNWNFSNIHAKTTEQRYQGRDTSRKTDPTTGETKNIPFDVPMRAYDTPWQGICDHVAYVHYRTPRGWRDAVDHDGTHFFSVLRSSGYFEGFGETDAQLDGAFAASYRDTRLALGRGVGQAAASAAGDAAILAGLFTVAAAGIGLTAWKTLHHG